MLSIFYLNVRGRSEEGSRLTDRDRVRQLVEERVARPGALEGGSRFWEARLVVP